MKEHFVRVITCSVLYVFAVFLVGLVRFTTLAQTSGAVVFVHAVIIDGNGGVPVEDGTVVVRGLKVEAIGPTSTVQIPTNSRVIDVAGKVVMPALADMHVHLTGGWDGEATDMLGYQRYLEFATVLRCDDSVGSVDSLTPLADAGANFQKNAVVSRCIGQADPKRRITRVKDQLGHTSIKMTVDVYGHLVPGANRQAVNRLPSLHQNAYAQTLQAIAAH